MNEKVLVLPLKIAICCAQTEFDGKRLKRLLPPAKPLKD